MTPLFIIATLVLAIATAVPLINLLIWLIVFVVVTYLIYLLLGALPLPEPWKTVVFVLVTLILLLILVQQLGLLTLR
jgi:hypothetical protein